MKEKAIEIYIHIPFCVKKCDYCDFLSFSADDDCKERYVETIIKEISLESAKYRDRYVSSVFIGGGTPSSLQIGCISRIMSTVHECFEILDDAEITIECNPGTLSREKLLEYKTSGINRLSIGLQSTDDRELMLLGRIHNYDSFLENYKLARECGFDNINIDLISGLPGQDVTTFEKSLNRVIELEPEHISAYGLIIEEATPFIEIYGEGCERARELPSEEVERDIYHRTKEILEVAGYHRYEISNYSKSGYECRHNLGYWTRREYIGLGIGAASLYDNVRWINTRDIKKYMDDIPRNEGVKENIEELSIEEQMEEYMFLGLRLIDGVSIDGFERIFEKKLCDIAGYREHTGRMVKEGLVSIDKDRLKLTDKGLDLANYVMSGYIL